MTVSGQITWDLWTSVKNKDCGTLLSSVVQQAKNKVAVSAVPEENVTASYSEVIYLHTGLPKSILSYAALYKKRSKFAVLVFISYHSE